MHRSGMQLLSVLNHTPEHGRIAGEVPLTLLLLVEEDHHPLLAS